MSGSKQNDKANNNVGRRCGNGLGVKVVLKLVSLALIMSLAS